MHGKVYKQGKSTGDKPAVKEAYRIDIPAKHDCIYLHSGNHIPVQENPEKYSHQHSCHCQQDILSEYILRHLLIIESQHL